MPTLREVRALHALRMAETRKSAFTSVLWPLRRLGHRRGRKLKCPPVVIGLVVRRQRFRPQSTSVVVNTAAYKRPQIVLPGKFVALPVLFCCERNGISGREPVPSGLEKDFNPPVNRLLHYRAQLPATVPFVAVPAPLPTGGHRDSGGGSSGSLGSSGGKRRGESVLLAGISPRPFELGRNAARQKSGEQSSGEMDGRRAHGESFGLS
jgi:hypothetical protein